MNQERYAADAGELIGYGLRPKLRPSEDGDYADLLRRYDEQPEFASAVVQTADGMGLRVLAASDRAGLVLGAAEDSAFAVRVSDYAKEASVESKVSLRVMHGLAHLAIAASAFPRPADLDDPDHIGRLTVSGVDRYLRDLCRRLDEQIDDDNVDAPADEPLLERAWRSYGQRPPVIGTVDGRAGNRSTQQAIARACNWLVEQGMLSRVSEDDGGTFRSTERYRIEVKHLACHETWLELRTAMGDDPDEAVTEAELTGVAADPSLVADDESAEVIA